MRKPYKKYPPRVCIWWKNLRFNLGYRIGGFTSAKRDR